MIAHYTIKDYNRDKLQQIYLLPSPPLPPPPSESRLSSTDKVYSQCIGICSGGHALFPFCWSSYLCFSTQPWLFAIELFYGNIKGLVAIVQPLT